MGQLGYINWGQHPSGAMLKQVSAKTVAEEKQPTLSSVAGTVLAGFQHGNRFFQKSGYLVLPGQRVSPANWDCYGSSKLGMQ